MRSLIFSPIFNPKRTVPNLAALTLVGLLAASGVANAQSVVIQDAPAQSMTATVTETLNAAKEQFQAGQKSSQDRQYRAAIGHYNQAILRNPSYGDAYYGRAMAKVELGDKVGAIGDLGEVLRLDPQQAMALGQRANL